MRYNNSELFDIPEQQYQSWLDDDWTPREFMLHCEKVLARLVEESVQLPNWQDTDIKHLRNYRMKAMEFYREKRGEK